MPGASIVCNQPTGAGAGSPGVARNDLWKNQAIILAQGAGGNTQFLWELLDKPPGSAATLSTPTAASSGFTPDAIGTYRIRLTTNTGGPGNVQIRVFRVRYGSSGVLESRGWAYPAYEEQSDESNYGSNDRGWSEPFEFILEDVRTALGMMGGSSATSYVYKYGGVTSGNVYNTWTGAHTAAAAVSGLGVIEVDDILASPGTPSVPSAVFALRSEIGIAGRVSRTELQLSAGSALTNPRFLHQLDIEGHDNTLRFLDTSNTIVFTDCELTYLTGATTGSIVLTTGKTLNIFASRTHFASDGTTDIIEIQAGATLNLYLDDYSILDADVFAGGGTINIFSREKTTVSVSHTNFSGSLTHTASDMVLHIAASDPHTQYQKESEKNAVNGYPGLDGSSKIAGAQITYGTASNTAAEGNDARIPTQSENDALAGTNGTPSGANAFVTNTDPRNTDSRAPSGSASGDLGGTYPSPTVQKLSGAVATTNGQLVSLNTNGTIGVSSAVVETPSVRTIFAGSDTEDSNAWKAIAAFQFDKANLIPTPTTINLVAFLQTTNASSESRVRLYNQTDASVVTGSSLNTTSTSPTLVTGALTLPVGSKLYLVQIQTETPGEICTCLGATINPTL
jgi:hypothetical protein